MAYYFHGDQAVAALKPIDEYLGREWVFGFPRRSGRGRIEAFAVRDGEVAKRQISTAIRPWPH